MSDQTIKEPVEKFSKAKAMGFKTLIIGQPVAGRDIPKKTYLSMLQIMSPNNMIELLDKHKVVSTVRVLSDFPIDYNRNKFVDDSIEAGADYLMFMDMDMTFPPDTLNILFDLISDEHPVVAGMYYLKKEPFAPVIGDYTDWTDKLLPHKDFLEKHGFLHPDGRQLLEWRNFNGFDKDKLFYADVIGAGCFLAKIDVFKKLQKPYFKYIPDPRKDPTHNKISEDMYFCAQLKKAGIPILVTPQIQCGHIMEMESNHDLWLSQKEACLASLQKEGQDKVDELVAKFIYPRYV
jgi:hypothetical protein